MTQVTKAKNEMWDQACSRINCRSGFKESRKAWSILKNLRKQDIKREQISLQRKNGTTFTGRYSTRKELNLQQTLWMNWRSMGTK
jgi:hypothetical protein